MRRQALATAAWAAALFASLSVGHAADLIWEVENPFRFFKPTQLVRAARGRLQRGARRSVRARCRRTSSGAPSAASTIPTARIPRTPTSARRRAGKRYQQSRLGWAAQTVGETCYDSNGHPRRYSAVCERKYSWGTAKEDYVLPEAHTVAIRIAPEQLAGVTGDCIWSWQPRKAGGKAETKKLACKDKLVIARVPYSLDRANSGVAVTVKLPDGRELAEPDVVVEDIFIVALGDSFASGESNPDRPVQFSAAREMVYDPELATTAWPRASQPEAAAAAALAWRRPTTSTIRRCCRGATWRTRRPSASTSSTRRNSRPRSRRPPRAGSAATATARNTAIRSASRIQLALENRHRSVTLASFTCSGAEVVEGLFGELDPREGSEQGPRAARPVERSPLPRRRARRARATRCRCSRSAAPDHGAAVHQDLVPAAAAQAADRRRADVDRRQRRGLRCARGLCHDRERRRSCADRGLDRRADPVRPAGLARLSRRARRAHEGGQGGAARRLRRCAVARGAVVLRADPVRRDRSALRRAADARARRASRPASSTGSGCGETADFLRDFLGRLECIAGGKSAPAARPIWRPAPAPASRW